MGRVFEKRKYKMFARYDKMAKGFTRAGKEIAIAVKLGGADPQGNSRLRVAIQNAKGINMPKDRIDAAIKRASAKDEKGLEEIVYEGKGPFGVGILIECATDNPTRTVANVRMNFNRNGGELGKTGSLDYLFIRKGVFRIKKENIDPEELELELIDHGADEIESDEEEIVIYTAFTDFGTMQKALEAKKLNIISSELERIPTSTVELSDEQVTEVMALVEKLEEDDDVQTVYHNMK
ncbi:MAG TPA: YebC/PmpR family DNA-binding transcriptional regulator [Bacteroidia bacterium]|jgi:YebC/PmpR family DNA-binding regulatory protein|nr:YebC/PmpR family DNA-binding transcriptional regulator [Bacteroidia bacterium]